MPVHNFYCVRMCVNTVFFGEFCTFLVLGQDDCLNSLLVNFLMGSYHFRVA